MNINNLYPDHFLNNNISISTNIEYKTVIIKKIIKSEENVDKNSAYYSVILSNDKAKKVILTDRQVDRFMCRHFLAVQLPKKLQPTFEEPSPSNSREFMFDDEMDKLPKREGYLNKSLEEKTEDMSKIFNRLHKSEEIKVDKPLNKSNPLGKSSSDPLLSKTTQHSSTTNTPLKTSREVAHPFNNFVNSPTLYTHTNFPKKNSNPLKQEQEIFNPDFKDQRSLDYLEENSSPKKEASDFDFNDLFADEDRAYGHSPDFTLGQFLRNNKGNTN